MYIIHRYLILIIFANIYIFFFFLIIAFIENLQSVLYVNIYMRYNLIFSIGSYNRIESITNGNYLNQQSNK